MVFWVIAGTSFASELTFGFKNPTFSGDGFSSHMLTIENQEFARRRQIESEKRAAAEAVRAAENNTNLSKFLNNLESRIYAQLSLQMSNAMFSDGSTSGTLDFQGSTINWSKDLTAGMISLTIIDENGNRTEIQVPTGSFRF